MIFDFLRVAKARILATSDIIMPTNDEFPFVSSVFSAYDIIIRRDFLDFRILKKQFF